MADNELKIKQYHELLSLHYKHALETKHLKAKKQPVQTTSPIDINLTTLDKNINYISIKYKALRKDFRNLIKEKL